MGMKCWPLLFCQADDSEHTALQAAPALCDCSHHSQLTCFALFFCLCEVPSWSPRARLSPVSHHTVVLLPGAPLSLLPAVAGATGNGGCHQYTQVQAGLQMAMQHPMHLHSPRMAMLAPWHPFIAPGWLPWPELMGPCAAAEGLLLLHGTGSARVIAPWWAAGGSQWDLGSLSHCAGESNTSCTTMLALSSSCSSKSTGGAGLERTKVSAGLLYHTMPPLLTPHYPQEDAERDLTSCAACLIFQEPCRTVACLEPNVSAGLQTTQVTDCCVTTHLLCLPPALSGISVVTVVSSSCHHLSPSVTYTTLRLGH